ncbi:S-adenosylmethionine synthase [Trichinella spiralis]|uniref:S-adenosylmethionine synthase n=1 Tax=Trichinella spiralis TaxID=6334 RepID=A0ABR3KBN4_TRISP
MSKQKKESLQRYVTTAQNSFRVHKTCAVVHVNTSLSSGYSTELKHMCFACQGPVIRTLTAAFMHAHHVDRQLREASQKQMIKPTLPAANISGGFKLLWMCGCLPNDCGLLAIPTYLGKCQVTAFDKSLSAINCSARPDISRCMNFVLVRESKATASSGPVSRRISARSFRMKKLCDAVSKKMKTTCDYPPHIHHGEQLCILPPYIYERSCCPLTGHPRCKQAKQSLFSNTMSSLRGCCFRAAESGPQYALTTSPKHLRGHRNTTYLLL